MESEKVSDLNRAFAGLWLDHDLEEANDRLRIAFNEIVGKEKKITPSVADEKAKWQMRTWIRIYYLFSDKSAWFPGRLQSDIQEKIEFLFWNYGLAKSSIERADPKYVWFIQGSENHDMMDLGNAFLALQALKDLPKYSGRKLTDGHSIEEHLAAWNSYFKLYCTERCKHGLFIEVGSPTYGKYLIPEIVNLFDFAEDSELRSKAKTLLDLTWANWSMEQLGGVRGGGKARCYQGNYSRNGRSDSWFQMGHILLGSQWALDGSRYTHPIQGFGFVLATTGYFLPELVKDLALSPEDRGEYAVVSQSPGKMKSLDEIPPYGGHSCWYSMDSKDPRLVRYTWCTPDHIMGSFWVDPSLAVEFNIHPDQPERADNSYPAISAQNRWQGIVFATDPDARIFPQCVGKPDKNHPGLSTTYDQQIAVQHENVMLIRKNPAMKNLTGLRVYLSPGMKERIVEEGGWWLIEEGDSCAAFRAFSATGEIDSVSMAWDDDSFLRLSEPDAPIVFVTGRKKDFPEVDDFLDWVNSHESIREGDQLDYRFTDSSGSDRTLTIWLRDPKLPAIDGEPIQLSPTVVYQSPFLNSRSDGNGAILQFKGHEIQFDF
ncbi:MAG: hypothetical protein KC994_13800 [Candidatus Omnitrophica bacterium]|nr:hypothetical protein [Candidatus Omnitrophota bacterium]